MTTVSAQLKRRPLTAENVFRFLVDRSTNTVRTWSILALVFVSTLAALVLHNGPSHIMAPWDVFILLDGSWRIVSGQIPHTDFHNAIGPLTYELVAFGMRIAGPSLTAVVYGQLAFLFGATAWAWLIGRQRLSGLNCFILVVFIALLAVATRPLGFDPQITTYALLYNRYGWILFALLLIELYIEHPDKNSATGLIEGISIGLLLALLFFDKVSYFAAGVLAVAAQIALRRSSVASIAGQVVGFAGVGFGLWWALHISTANYIQDILFAGRSQSLLLRLHFLASGLKNNWQSVIVFAGIMALLYLTLSRLADDSRSLAERYAPILAATVCLATAFLIVSGNASEGSDIPIWSVAGLVLLEAVSRQFSPLSTARSAALEAWYVLTFLLVTVVFAGPIMVKDGLSVLNTAAWREYRISAASASQRLDSATLGDFMVPASSEWQTAYWRAKVVPARINDGLQLLRRHVTPTSRIFTVALTDPFSVALGLPSPKGSLAWWDLNFSFSDRVYPSASDTFRDVDLVIIPVLLKQDDGCCQPTVLRMLEIYGPYLQDRFVQLDQTGYWTLMQRRY